MSHTKGFLTYQGFSNVFRGYRNGRLTWKGLIYCNWRLIFYLIFINILAKRDKQIRWFYIFFADKASADRKNFQMWQKFAETFDHRCSENNLFWKILQNSQEDTRQANPFFINGAGPIFQLKQHMVELSLS